nr:ribosomal RNA methyltransferase (FmrO) [uncultured bacterium]
MLKTNKDVELARLVQDIQQSGKYGDICLALIEHVGRQELSKRRNVKEALKATKNKLHQIGGAYLDGREQYQQWLRMLAEAQAEQGTDNETFKAVSLQLMGKHASTRERRSILPDFYPRIFAELPPIHSVIDIACGLNPLAHPWMPLAPAATYDAYDIYQGMMTFLNDYFALRNIRGTASACDVIQSCPTQEVDVALLLKVLPCLEQLEKWAAHHLLHTLNARYLIVSYPIQSLGGKSKGMSTYYESHFRSLISDTPWTIKKLEFANEMVFVVAK